MPGIPAAAQTHSSAPVAVIHHVSRPAPAKVARDIHAIATSAGSFLYQSIHRALSCLPFAVVIERKAVVLHYRIAAGGVSLTGTLAHHQTTLHSLTHPTSSHIITPQSPIHPSHTFSNQTLRHSLTHLSRTYPPTFLHTHCQNCALCSVQGQPFVQTANRRQPFVPCGVTLPLPKMFRQNYQQPINYYQHSNNNNHNLYILEIQSVPPVAVVWDLLLKTLFQHATAPLFITGPIHNTHNTKDGGWNKRGWISSYARIVLSHLAILRKMRTRFGPFSQLEITMVLTYPLMHVL